mgnify:CR=1 FL=1
MPELDLRIMTPTKMKKSIVQHVLFSSQASNLNFWHISCLYGVLPFAQTPGHYWKSASTLSPPPSPLMTSYSENSFWKNVRGTWKSFQPCTPNYYWKSASTPLSPPSPTIKLSEEIWWKYEEILWRNMGKIWTNMNSSRSYTCKECTFLFLKKRTTSLKVFCMYLCGQSL